MALTGPNTQEFEVIIVSSDPQYSAAKSLGSYQLHSWQFDYTNGTGVTITVQYSNNNSTWVTDTTCSAVLGASGTALLAPIANGASYGRVKFAGATGCVGTITFNRKGRGH